MGQVKAELDDLAFKYAYPDEYRWVKNEVKDKIPQRKSGRLDG